MSDPGNRPFFDRLALWFENAPVARIVGYVGVSVIAVLGLMAASLSALVAYWTYVETKRVDASVQTAGPNVLPGLTADQVRSRQAALNGVPVIGANEKAVLGGDQQAVEARLSESAAAPSKQETTVGAAPPDPTPPSARLAPPPGVVPAPSEPVTRTAFSPMMADPRPSDSPPRLPPPAPPAPSMSKVRSEQLRLLTNKTSDTLCGMRFGVEIFSDAADASGRVSLRRSDGSTLVLLGQKPSRITAGCSVAVLGVTEGAYRQAQIKETTSD